MTSVDEAAARAPAAMCSRSVRPSASGRRRGCGSRGEDGEEEDGFAQKGENRIPQRAPRPPEGAIVSGGQGAEEGAVLLGKAKGKGCCFFLAWGWVAWLPAAGDQGLGLADEVHQIR